MFNMFQIPQISRANFIFYKLEIISKMSSNAVIVLILFLNIFGSLDSEEIAISRKYS
jgi:hypothetical protein